jgi:hypothetical protein
MRNRWIRGLAVMTFLVGGLLFVHSVARADTPPFVAIILPDDVTVVVGQSKVLFTGRSLGTMSVECIGGGNPIQSAIVVDPGGRQAAQQTTAVALHDHALQPGARYRIVFDFGPCGEGSKQYQGLLD